MIDFDDDDAKIFWESCGGERRRFSAFADVLMRKLRMINAAKALTDLKIPPGNRLEALHGDRKGQYSIRINIQFRICFVWTADGAKNVQVADYH